MNKLLLKLCILLFLLISIQNLAISEDDDWSKAIEVYDSDGLDKPVSAIEYQKVMKELQELKDKKNKKKKWFNRNQEPEPKIPNEPVKTERNDILKTTMPLYYDGKILPVGFYKITCNEENHQYYLNFTQGKAVVVRVLATKVSHASFCPDKVNCLTTEIYKNDYFKINFKNIDNAVCGYLTILK